MTDVSEQVLDIFSSLEPDLESLYRQLHEHPELALQEEATAAEVSRRLTDYGFEVTTGVAGTGVVGVLRSGDEPTVMLRGRHGRSARP